MRIRSEVHSKPNQLKGPQGTHAVRELALRVERMPTGGMRISTPSARGWAVIARSEAELHRAVSAAFTEAQCAAYARWKGERYELDALTEPVPGDALATPRTPPRRGRNTAPVGWGKLQQRPDRHPPSEWTKLEDGAWRSPGGNRYKAGTQAVEKLIARRKELGLPT